MSESQAKFACLIGCSIHTLQSIETGRLQLSKRLATRISEVTGVHADWLLSNDLNAEPEAATPSETSPQLFFFAKAKRPGQIRKVIKITTPYTLDTFREAKRLGQIPEFISQMIPDYMFSFYGQLRAILDSAAKNGLAGAAIFKTAQWLDGLRRQFGHDNSVVPTPELRLRGDGSPVLTYRQRDGGLRAIKKDVADWTKEFEQAAPKKKRTPKKKAKSRLKRQKNGNGSKLT